MTSRDDIDTILKMFKYRVHLNRDGKVSYVEDVVDEWATGRSSPVYLYQFIKGKPNVSACGGKYTPKTILRKLINKEIFTARENRKSVSSAKYPGNRLEYNYSPMDKCMVYWGESGMDFIPRH